MIPRLCRAVKVSGQFPGHHGLQPRLQPGWAGHSGISQQVTIRASVIVAGRLSTDVIGVHAQHGQLSKSSLCAVRRQHRCGCDTGHRQKQCRETDPQVVESHAVHARCHTVVIVGRTSVFNVRYRSHHRPEVIGAFLGGHLRSSYPAPDKDHPAVCREGAAIAAGSSCVGPSAVQPPPPGTTRSPQARKSRPPCQPMRE